MPAAPVPPSAVPALPPRTPLRITLLTVGVLGVSVVAGLIGLLLAWAFGLVAGGTTTDLSTGGAVLGLVVTGLVTVGLWVAGVVLLIRRLFPAGVRADTTMLVMAAGTGASLVALFGRGLEVPAVVVGLLTALPQVLMAAVLHARDAGLRRDAAGAARRPGGRRG